MTFYILDHGSSSRDRYGIYQGPSFGITLGGSTKVLATRPTQRAAEELVVLLRNQEKERGR